MNPKFPRTFHLPWSEEISDDDKRLKNVSHLLHTKLSISIKMDGSNVGISKGGGVTTRSGNQPKYESFDLLKQKYSLIKYELPECIIFYGEWMYSVHSIEYTNLDDYLLIFAAFDVNNNKWLSVDDLIEYCRLIGLSTVPFIKNGLYYRSESDFKNGVINIAKNVINEGHEGIVIRKSGSFDDYKSSTGKYVRERHVKTDEHWIHKPIKKNMTR